MAKLNHNQLKTLARFANDNSLSINSINELMCELGHRNPLNLSKYIDLLKEIKADQEAEKAANYHGLTTATIKGFNKKHCNS